MHDAFVTETKRCPQTRINNTAIFTAGLIVTCPIFIAFLDAEVAGNLSLILTVSFGICALLSIMLRKRTGLEYFPSKEPIQDMRITHTAFALGCIPALILLFIDPNMLANRAVFVREIVNVDRDMAFDAAYYMAQIFSILGLTAWVAVTEEFIFRGLLISLIRRWKTIKSLKTRNYLAIILSSLLFGLAHYPTWGLTASLALTGLGAGFALAYISIGEKLTPIIIYHFIFDTLSVLISLLPI